jgi:hypothetical protein
MCAGLSARQFTTPPIHRKRFRDYQYSKGCSEGKARNRDNAYQRSPQLPPSAQLRPKEIYLSAPAPACVKLSRGRLVCSQLNARAYFGAYIMAHG